MYALGSQPSWSGWHRGQQANRKVYCPPLHTVHTLLLLVLLQVESIVISIIAMLSSPNDESPANVDAAKQWREDRDGFRKKVARIVRKSQENFD